MLWLSVAGLAAGVVLHWRGAGDTGDLVWIGVASLGIAVAATSAAWSLARRRMGVDLIAILALVGAVAVGEYFAAAVISVMLSSGRALEAWAAGRASHELRALLARAPVHAHRYAHGELREVPLGEIVVGDLVMVASGEVVPVDGFVAAAPAVLDESALTGEARPVERASGEPVRSGVVNAGQPFDLRVTAAAADSTYAGIVRLVSEAQDSQAPMARLADRYAVGFLAVTLLAAGLAWAAGGASRAVAVLVVATPCPLILAAPVAFVSGISRAAKRGVVVKGGAVIERLARCTTMLVDKTGTITVGRPELTGIASRGSVPDDELLALSASLEQVSPHVLASAVVRAAAQRGLALELPDDTRETLGAGITGVVGGRRVAVGTAAWVGLAGDAAWARAARRAARIDGAITVWVGVDGEPAAMLTFDDPIRPDASRTIRALRREGIDRIVMVTGDRAEVAEAIGAVIGLDEVLAERSPDEKLVAVRAEAARATTMMVGDGINDAPALALADVGVAMGVRGATAASEAADVVLSVDRIDRLGEAAVVARRTLRIALQSMVAGMALSLTAMCVAGIGLLPVVWGALLQEAIDVAVILNALRALGGPRGEPAPSGEDRAAADRFRRQHRLIRADIARIRSVADDLDAREPARSLREARGLHEVLVRDVLPHELAEERELYPALGRHLGGSDPMAAMTSGHAEIVHRVRRLGRLLDELGDDQLDEYDVTELRRSLYGLQAILKLHTAQEDESYLVLTEDAAAP